MSNRPDWCPEDVWEVALEIYDPAAWHIARAILAERERCARIAEHMLKFADTTSRADEEIARAIRDPQA